jgi:putative MATE family efflux protein
VEQQLNRKTKLITEGSIVKAMIMIAWPIVLANTLATAYQLIDTFWVGRLGAAAVAAVSVGTPLIFLFMSFGFGLAIGGSVFVAQYAGAGKYEDLNHVTAQAILTTIVSALVLSLIGFLIAPHILRLIGVSTEIFADANSYLRISYCALVFSFGSIVFQSILRGIGEVYFPLYVISTTVLLNAALDPLFIFGWGPIPGYGVTGAAYATACTQAVAALVGIGVLFQGRYGIHIKLRDFIPDYARLKQSLVIGLPASIEQSTRVLGSIMLTFLAAGFGTLALATFGIGMRLLSFIFIPAFGLAMATTILVGQNIGAGNIERAEETTRLSAWVAFWFFNSVALLFYVFAASIVRFFVPTDETLVIAGSEFVHIAALSFGLIAVQQVLLGAFRGAGGTGAAMVISLVSQWLLQFPMSYIMCMHTPLGVAGIWWGFPAANLIATLVTIIWFKGGRWKHKKLTEEQKVAEELVEEIFIE